MRYRSINIVLFFSLFLHTACRKDITPHQPGDSVDVRVNYLSNSDVLNAFSIGGLGIFANAVPKDAATSTGTSVPYFSMARGQVQLEFPKIFGASGLMYMPYLPGQHRIQFAYMAPDSSNTFTGTRYVNTYLDTTLHFVPGSEMLVNLIDGLPDENSSEPVFRLLAVEARRSMKLDTDQVAICITHQSPDTDPVKLSRVTAGGSITNEGLSQHLPYGQATEWVLLNTREAKNGLIALRIYSSLTGQELLNTALPANSGHAYTLAITGFRTQRNFRIPIGVNSDKKVVYGTTTIPSNLRAMLRQIW